MGDHEYSEGGKRIVNEMNERVITMKQGVIVSDEQKGGYIDED